MAINRRLAGSTDWGSAAHWTDGVPTASDVVYIDDISDAITGTPDQSAVNDMVINTGPNFTGSLGTPSTPIKFGTGTTIRCNSPLAQAINVFPSTSAEVTVMECNANAYGFHLYDGTITAFNVINGKGVRIGALANLTAFYIVPTNSGANSAYVYIESGAACPIVRQTGGTVQCAAAVGGTTLDIHGGEWQHIGDTTGAIAGTFNQYGGKFLFNSPGMTITDLRIYGGIFDATQIGLDRTITNAQVWRGGALYANTGMAPVTFSNAVVVRGGRAIGNYSKTIAIPEASYDSIV